ncbi:MAG: MATE family efflux transporter, partial [Nesterenkonia sp.]
WAIGFGVVVGVLTAAAAPWAPYLFTPSDAVAEAITVALFVLAVSQPLAGYVFVLDGVLMGAGDVRYLALVGVVNLGIYLPVLWWVHRTVAGGEPTHIILWLWLAFAVVFMGARALTLGIRAAGRRWMVLGE